MKRLAPLRVVVTRAAHQAEELARLLRAAGAEAILVPVIEIAAPSDPAPLRQAAAAYDSFDWIIFTSANAVQSFGQELPIPGTSTRTRVAAIGTATRAAAEQAGFTVELIPKKYVAESLVAAFAEEDLRGKRILIPSAAVTRDVIPGELRKLGAEVTVVEAYRNVIPARAAESVQQAFREPWPHWVTFASPSAVDNLVRLAGTKGLKPVRIASVGPVTSMAIRRYGLPVDAEASVQTMEGLVEALLAGARAADL